METELALLQSVIEAMPDGIVVIDRDERLIAWNRRYAEMWRIPEELFKNLESRKLIEFIASQTVDPNASDLIELKDGRFFERYSAGRKIGETPAGRLVYFRDVTERVRFERSLSESEERFRRIFESAAFGLTLFDMKGRFLACNPAICRMLGYTEAEMKDIGVRGISDPTTYSGENQRLLSEMIAGEIDRFEIEKKYRKKDGSAFWGQLVSSLVRNSDGEPIYGIGMVIDISRQKAVEEEMRNALRIRDEFIAVASHELRTPVTPLRLQNHLLRRHLKSEQLGSLPQVGHILRIIDISEQQLDHLVQLIEDMLNASRISAGRIELDLSEANLSELVTEVVERHRDEFRKAACELRVEIEPGIRSRCDGSRISQVLTNLLTNASKYGRGSPVAIRLESGGGVARLSVRDSGIGIAKENHSRIFEQFERVAPVGTYGGFGLGLYIVRQIVNAHGGAIRVQSELGSGAEFTVELPGASGATT